MNFLEKDLEQIIWESDNEKLQKRMLKISGKKFRQLKIGNYGISDLVTVKKDYYYHDESFKVIPFLKITVFELKKEKVGISAFLQAIRYCKGIKDYFDSNRANIDFELNIALIAKSVDTQSDFIFLTDLFGKHHTNNKGLINNINFYSFSYGLDGILFTKHDRYCLTNKGF